MLKLLLTLVIICLTSSVILSTQIKRDVNSPWDWTVESANKSGSYNWNYSTTYRKYISLRYGATNATTKLSKFISRNTTSICVKFDYQLGLSPNDSFFVQLTQVPKNSGPNHWDVFKISGLKSRNIEVAEIFIDGLDPRFPPMFSIEAIYGSESTGNYMAVGNFSIETRHVTSSSCYRDMKMAEIESEIYARPKLACDFEDADLCGNSLQITLHDTEVSQWEDVSGEMIGIRDHSINSTKGRFAILRSGNSVMQSIDVSFEHYKCVSFWYKTVGDLSTITIKQADMYGRNEVVKCYGYKPTNEWTRNFITINATYPRFVINFEGHVFEP